MFILTNHSLINYERQQIQFLFHHNVMQLLDRCVYPIIFNFTWLIFIDISVCRLNWKMVNACVCVCRKLCMWSRQKLNCRSPGSEMETNILTFPNGLNENSQHQPFNVDAFPPRTIFFFPPNSHPHHENR